MINRWPCVLPLLCGLLGFASNSGAHGEAAAPTERHLLYVAAPGIRDYLQFGGAGILVFDVDRDHALVKRIETPASREKKPENIKGICASAKTGKLYFSTLNRLYCLDLATEKTLWEKALPGGCDRMSITPDGRKLYVPTLEKDWWNVVEGATGEVLTRIETKSGSHNTVVGVDGSRAYLAGLRSSSLIVLDTSSDKVLSRVGPFAAPIRPFTVNGSGTLCFVNVNGLLGFEVGDLVSGKKLYRVEAGPLDAGPGGQAEEFKRGPIKRHGCPSHGVAMTPDESEIWVCDAANSRVHIYDAVHMPPHRIASVKVREQPGWITFSLDGRYAYPSTGDVIETRTRRIVTGLTDERGRQVHSEKMLEIDFKDGVPIRAGDQFGLGRKRK
jgi:DNA-binding beta-propeller fold protein YncE